MKITGEPTNDERQRISELKPLTYAGFMPSIADGATQTS